MEGSKPSERQLDTSQHVCLRDDVSHKLEFEVGEDVVLEDLVADANVFVVVLDNTVIVEGTKSAMLGGSMALLLEFLLGCSLGRPLGYSFQDVLMVIVLDYGKEFLLLNIDTQGGYLANELRTLPPPFAFFFEVMELFTSSRDSQIAECRSQNVVLRNTTFRNNNPSGRAKRLGFDVCKCAVFPQISRRPPFLEEARFVAV